MRIDRRSFLLGSAAAVHVAHGQSGPPVTTILGHEAMVREKVVNWADLGVDL